MKACRQGGGKSVWKYGISSTRIKWKFSVTFQVNIVCTGNQEEINISIIVLIEISTITERYGEVLFKKKACITLYYQEKCILFGHRVGNLFEMQYHQISRNKDHVEESSDVIKNGIRFEEEKHQKNIR